MPSDTALTTIDLAFEPMDAVERRLIGLRRFATGESLMLLVPEPGHADGCMRKRLSPLTCWPVEYAVDGMAIRPGRVYLATQAAAPRVTAGRFCLAAPSCAPATSQPAPPPTQRQSTPPAPHANPPPPALPAGVAPVMADARLLPDELLHREIVRRLARAAGVDFTQYKDGTLRRRISRRMLLRGVHQAQAYIDLLDREPEELRELFGQVLIPVTELFRDRDCFELLRAPLANQMRDHPEGKAFVLWVAGCSTGEEAVSLAVLAIECMESIGRRLALRVIGSDIRLAPLVNAGHQRFPAAVAQRLTPRQLTRFFEPCAEGYTLRPEVRRHCHFVQHDLLTPPPIERADLISCRNVLIYFKAAAQQRVMARLAGLLAPTRGLLFLGPAESLGNATRALRCIDHRARLYRYISTYRGDAVAVAGPDARP